MVDTEEMIPAVSAEGPGRPDLRNLGGGLNTSTEGPAASQGSGRVALRTLRELDAAVHTCGLSVKQEPRDSDCKPFHHPEFIGTAPRDRRGLLADSQPAHCPSGLVARAVGTEAQEPPRRRSPKAVLQAGSFQFACLDTAARSSSLGDTWAQGMSTSPVTGAGLQAGERPSAVLDPPKPQHPTGDRPGEAVGAAPGSHRRGTHLCW